MAKWIWAGLYFAVTVTGCGMDVEADPSIANEEGALRSQNGLTSNGLTSNGLTSNGLTSNALVSSALSHSLGAADGPVLRALRDASSGSLARVMFRYLVACALRPDQSVRYTWRAADGRLVNEINIGELGLAPGWTAAALDKTGREWVSACVAARTNQLGRVVPISLRAKDVASLAVSVAERSEYAVPEGAFWGDVFSSPPRLYACAIERPVGSASWLLSYGRTCTTSGCGIIKAMGTCRSATAPHASPVCSERASNGDWVNGCRSGDDAAHRSAHVLTTWVRPRP